MTSMGEIHSGVVDLCDIALMNDYLDLDEDNRARAQRWRVANER